mmetsp:Transcript_6137/g.9588  ORF Transcript_6137/g.9588 Transcript_6137/m.9588 type:complete len:865 (-) Transcript_6137:419-3013(-)|eukprot:CAMPEP_0203797660 /NCGR_PEP_ID=MMETSP0100_2-20121128/8768_1 /ASSEMBLY_ACC=CAM_ASM_000210 /TAXON_ID=96639 /ORGANISM=" , Strain NY0313808BC1" /LENGTH=864 /DNA_ID=CAMNT_0050703023 /DNA_START=214 /DNA_END=2808 /DNA_ORIENTATION=-
MRLLSRGSHRERRLSSQFRALRRSFGSVAGAYDHKAIEKKWRDQWRADRASAGAPGEDKENRYILCQFPYPSGNLHLGHVRVYTIGDSLARAHRMLGCNVLFPMGWDAFGLPAENAAVERGIKPQDWTETNIAHMKGQLEPLGFSFDWDREVSTCDPAFYKWTQWLFTQLYKSNFAYQAEAMVNWDPVDQTVLANEQVDDQGRSWRSGAVVEKRMLKQWFLQITSLADELLGNLETELDPRWPVAVRSLQKNWIGKSTGAEVQFDVDGERVSVFTTRPDTLFGVTFLAVSKSHPLTKRVDKDVLEQVENVRDDDERGVDLGLFARNPLNNKLIPVFVAPYVLDNYGEGAVMGVPGHDTRDARFAEIHGIDIVTVVDENGKLVSSDEFNGLDAVGKGAQRIVETLQANAVGKPATTYRLRDWLVSRQRGWGTPIPIIHCDTCGPVSVPDDQLPVVRPPVGTDAATMKAWEEDVKCPCCGSQQARRDTDTLDTFVDSSWYYLRYCDANNDKIPFSPESINKWMSSTGVDLYIGGIEHAILHLLYARFINLFLHKKGLASCPEPFHTLVAQGMVMGKTAKLQNGRYLLPDEWVDDGTLGAGESKNGEKYQVSWEKMSKSKYNGIDPDSVLDEHGADATRLAMLFSAPPEAQLEWDEGAVLGQTRFLKRVWKLALSETNTVEEDPTMTKTLEMALHASVLNIKSQIQVQRHLNVCISELMKLCNAIAQNTNANPQLRTHAIQSLVIMLAPFAPHIAEELWAHIAPQGVEGTIHSQPWPVADKNLAQNRGSVLVVVQISGKKQTVLEVELEIGPDGPLLPTKESLAELARNHISSKLAKWTIKKEIVVIPNKATGPRKQCIVNFVAAKK